MTTNNATSLSAEEIEREREKFERLMNPRRSWKESKMFTRMRPPDGDEYESNTTQERWNGWLAAKSESAAEIAALKADVEELVESLEKIHKIAERLFLYEPRLNAGVPDIRATASNILTKHRSRK